MKKMIFAIYTLVIAFAALNAQTATDKVYIRFVDRSDSTFHLFRLEDPGYQDMTPVESRWIMLGYLSEDDIIDPLSPNGEPTGDDIVNPFVIPIEGSIKGQVAGGALFGPAEYGSPFMPGFAIVTQEHFGKYLYIRVFNATSISKATKYIVLKHPHLVKAESNPVILDIFPDIGWDTEQVWKWIQPPNDLSED